MQIKRLAAAFAISFAPVALYAQKEPPAPTLPAQPPAMTQPPPPGIPTQVPPNVRQVPPGMQQLPPGMQQLPPGAMQHMPMQQHAPMPDIERGAAWAKWDAGKKAGYVEGFKSGTLWVAGESIVPPFAFKTEAVKSEAQKIWEQARNEYTTGLEKKQKELPGHEYTALHMMMFAMYDRYQRNGVYERAILKTATPTLVAGVDKLYADPANARIPVNVAVFVANKIASGAPQEDIDALMPYVRGERPVPPGWRVPVMDKSGKPTRYVEFP